MAPAMWVAIAGALAAAVLVVLVVWLWWRRRRAGLPAPRLPGGSGPRFSIEVRDGEVVHHEGEVSEGFLRDVERICKLWQLRQGTIRGYRGPRGIRIEVSGGIPRKHRLLFQNAWNHPI